jgi:hypothetical protein
MEIEHYLSKVGPMPVSLPVHCVPAVAMGNKHSPRTLVHELQFLFFNP